ncbi:MAG: prenyltransferase/squalene oxidase repeat-containing protein [Candidatus Helarchaeota archaeon]
MDSCFILNIKLENTIKNEITGFLFEIKNDDHGFGPFFSTLIDTYQALTILKFLNFNISSLKSVNFIKKCENSNFGFSNLRNTAPSFIEHVHAGIMASHLMNYRPLYLNQSINFIMRCQNNNGGFSRSTLGISTLENTHQAIEVLML